MSIEKTPQIHHLYRQTKGPSPPVIIHTSPLAMSPRLYYLPSTVTHGFFCGPKMNSTPGIDDQTAMLVDRIREAWYSGRTIVPLIGAGMSVDSGMPALSSIVRYIAKLKVYLDSRLYLPGNDAAVLLEGIDESFSKRPWEFIAAFGWPDRFQLNYDVRRGLDLQSSEMNHEIGKALDELAVQINPGGAWHLNDYIERVDSAFDAKGIAKASRPSTQRYVDSFLYQVAADWKPLLREITGHQQPLIDALFGRLARHRMPGPGHRFLAHLCLLLRIRTVLTFNFDQLIETALSDEQLPHRVFAMEHGAQLPAISLLDESLSLIKMHGGTHNILVDERVDYRVSQEYRDSFQRLVGSNPLLLVLGCSGNDRRLKELVTGTLEASSDATLAWIHRAENYDAKFLNSYRDKMPNRVLLYPSFDVGQTLRHVYSSLTERLPPGDVPYLAHISIPLLRESINQGTNTLLTSKPATLIFPDITSPFTRPYKSLTCGTLMSRLAQVPLGYTRLFVDLEEHHSWGQVAAEIITQIRSGDVTLAPYVSPMTPENAAKRVARALRRSRYVLVLSNIDALPWRSTTHHGLTSVYTAGREEAIQDQFRDFVSTLVQQLTNTWKLGDSCIVLHAEHPYARHSTDPSECESAAKVGKKLTLLAATIKRQCPKARVVKPSGNGIWPSIASVPKPSTKEAPQKLILPFTSLPCTISNKPEDPYFEIKLRTLWTAIVCHRRTRLMTGMGQLVKDLGVEDLLSCLVIRSDSNKTAITPLALTEGGGWWCDRPWRDISYDYVTCLTDKRTRDLMKRNAHYAISKFGACVSQHILMTALHDVIARNYYIHVYLPSQDSFAFLEYVYHRVSTLRYLAATSALLSWNDQPVSKVSDDLLEFAKCFGDRLGLDWSSALAPMRTSTPCFPSASQIDDIRVRCMRGFAETWKRTECDLRRTIPSDQLVTWCETLLTYDFAIQESGVPSKRRPGRVDVEYYELSKSVTPVEYCEEKASSEYSIRNTLNKCYYESAKFSEMHALRQSGPGVPASFPSKSVLMRSGPDTSDLCHDAVDSLLSQHWELFSIGADSTSFGKFGRNMEKVVVHTGLVPRSKAAGTNSNGDLAKLYPEVSLRLRYLLLETRLSRQSMIGRSGEAAPNIDLGANWKDEIKEAIDFAREEYKVKEGVEARSPILEQTSDRGLFIPYRSLFEILSGRYRMVAAAIEARERSPDWKTTYREAFRDFASARCGIGDENAILKVISDIGSADAAISHARSLYHVHSSSDDPQGKGLLNEVNVKLRSASGYLWKASENLAKAPQYVFVWKFFYVSQVNYHLERTVWNMLEAFVEYSSGEVASIERYDRRLTESGRLLDRARKGLMAIRHGLDHTCDAELRFYDEMRMQWARLGCASLAAAMLRKLVAEDKPFSSVNDAVSMSPLGGNYTVVHRLLARFWERLNDSQGLVFSVPTTGAKSVSSDEILPEASVLRDAEVGAGDYLFRPIVDQSVPGECMALRLRELQSRDMTKFLRLRHWIEGEAAHMILREGGAAGGGGTVSLK